MGSDYYDAAIAYIKKNIPNPELFVFSDDIAWVQENFKTDIPMMIVPSDIKDYEAGRLMSLCRHNIIANSTFSWWAAWLNTNEKKIVIAPKKWFNDPSRDTKEFLPSSWIPL